MNQSDYESYADIDRVLIPRARVIERVGELAARVSCDYAGRDLLCVGILKGAAIFFAELFSRITIRAQMDFMAFSSYGAAARSSGAVKLLKDLDHAVDGRNLLIIEDIVDTGLTLSYLTRVLSARGAASVRLCSLLDKPGRHETEIVLDYLGFSVENEFIVGFGIDYAEDYRNLPDICALKHSVYAP